MSKPESRPISAPVSFWHSGENQRFRIVPRAVLLGLCTGLLAVSFQWVLALVERQRIGLIERLRPEGPTGLLVFLAVTAVAVSLSTWLVRRYAPEAAGSGIPHLKGVLQGCRKLRGGRVIWVKFASGVLGIGSGLALGREGPTVQMGGAVGQWLEKHAAVAPEDSHIYIAAGSGAGLAAAFNAPLAGLMFVIEELEYSTSSLGFFVAAIACLISDLVSRWLMGQMPIFHIAVGHIPNLANVPAFFLLGILAGLLGVAFNKTLLFAVRFTRLKPARFRVLWGLLWACAIGLVGWHEPVLVGGGQKLIDCFIQGELGGAQLIVLFFVLRFSLLAGSYSTGAAGGIFAPLLVLGALLGIGWGDLAKAWMPWLEVETAVFAVVGMAALFTAIVRAPLTGVVLMIEMTSSYSLIMPLLTASLTALLVADACRDVPIYDALLNMDLPGKPLQSTR